MKSKGFGSIGNKYGNKKVYVDNIKFDSKKEAKRYQELKLLQEAGKIEDLELQPKFTIIPSIKRDWLHRTLRQTTYVADFYYIETDTGKTVVEDVKGYKTPVYALKKKLFILQYGEICEFREI